MKTFASLAPVAVFAAVVPALVVPAVVEAAAPEPQRRGDQRQAFDRRARGKLMALPEIERRIIPSMRGAQYIGVDFDPESGIYTLKFVRDGMVIWVEADGQNGQVVGRSGR